VQSFEIETDLCLSPEKAWLHMTSPSGVNAEFWPFMRMTFPGTMEDVTSDWRPGQRLFRSWLLLFGVIPVEYDDFGFKEVDKGKRFLEISEMLSQQQWIHEREISETPMGVRLSDRVSFVSRLPSMERIYLGVFRLVFRYRHFRLNRLYGHDAA